MPLPSFIQRGRRSLRRIDYYAARRPGDPWSRARRRAVVWSAPLALAALLLFEVLVTREETLRTLPAVMGGTRSGPIALATATNSAGDLLYPGGPLAGEVQMRIVRDARGWPFPTRVTAHRAALDINDYQLTALQIDVQLAADDPLWRALDRVSLEDAQWRRATDMLRGETARSDNRARRMITSSILVLGLWSMGIAGTCVITLRVAEVTVRVTGEARRQRRRSLAASNRCAACGYDMRGLDFHPRCPECGALVE